ncbi:MAG: flagellar biosynthesis protein FliQ [Bradymonadaceae bacterium]
MEDFILQITREGLYLVVIASAPPLLASISIGLLVSVFQATTQIQEQTLTFVPKLIGVFASLAIAGPWIGTQLVRFTQTLFEGFPNFF